MNIVRRLQACGGGARVLSVDYGLSPEYPYPTALNQVIQAYDWLVNDQHVAPSRIVIAGDSAGGALALLLACSLRDRQQAPTAGLALISPWVDFNGDDAYIRYTRMHIHITLYLLIMCGSCMIVMVRRISCPMQLVI